MLEMWSIAFDDHGICQYVCHVGDCLADSATQAAITHYFNSNHSLCSTDDAVTNVMF